MIDLSFKFEDKSERLGESIIEGKSLLGEKGVALVRFEPPLCEITEVTLEESEGEDYHRYSRFMTDLVRHILTLVPRVVWSSANLDEERNASCRSLVAEYEGKVVGDGRIRLKYSAGLVDGVYFVEARKKCYVKKRALPQEKPLPLPRSKTALPIDIADVQSWDSAEFGRMEYIVLSREDEKYWLFPYNESDEAEKVFNEDLVKDGVFSSEELDEVRSWAKREVADEKSELSRLFSLRREQYKARCKALSERRKEDEERIKANLQKLEG